jgi:CRISPR-associated endonuclease/helicase Cas3
VYGENDGENAGSSPPLTADLEEARRDMEMQRSEDLDEALKRLVPDCRCEGLLKERNLMLEEESPELHQTFRALTRLGPPSVAVVCLHRAGEHLKLEPDGTGPAVALDKVPNAALTGAIARHTIDVRHGAVRRRLAAQPVPAGWREHPLLRDHRAVVFTDGSYRLPDSPYTLCLDRELGLQIVKERS